MKQRCISVNWVPEETSIQFLTKYLDFYFSELCRTRITFWTTVRHKEPKFSKSSFTVIFWHKSVYAFLAIYFKIQVSRNDSTNLLTYYIRSENWIYLRNYVIK